MSIRTAQLGCLGMLLCVGILGFFVEHFGTHDKPGDNEGGGPLGAIGVVGFVLFFIVFAVVEVVRIISRRLRRKQDEK